MRDSPGPASDAAGAAAAPAAALPEHAAGPRGLDAAPAAPEPPAGSKERIAAPAPPLLELGPFELLREGRVLLRGGGLTLRPGERVLLTGPSGSGKSSLLLALAGLAEEHAPGLALRGALARRARVGALFQNPYAQLAAPDPEAEIALGLECAAWEAGEMRGRVAELVEAFRLGALRGRAPWTFSGGEAQRLALAAALAPRPGILLLDEPLGFLDAPSGSAFVELARSWPRDAAWIVVDHDPAAWASWAERHLRVDAEGRLAEAPLPASPNAPAAPAALPDSARLAPPLLEVEGLRAGYGRGPDALAGFGLRLAPGESLALVGPSGSGKSTLFACLCGSLRPRAGSIRLRGRPLSPRTRGPRRRPRGPSPFAWLPQVPEHYFVHGSAREEWAGAEEAARAFGLEALAERHPFTLSEGEKRRLNLASALGLGRDILLLDEPQFGLDAPSRAALDAALAELRARGQAMIVISHDPLFCAANAHRVQEMPS